MTEIIRKLSSSQLISDGEIDDGLESILSSERVDAMDDVLECTPASWDFSEHDKHPVLLPNHNSRANPIGIVKNKRVEGRMLRGRVYLARAGSSIVSDECRALVSQGILTGISVGFEPLESRPRPGSKKGGRIFSRMLLREVSLVSIPANSDAALMKCRSMGISDETQKLIFKGKTLGQRIRAARREDKDNQSRQKLEQKILNAYQRFLDSTSAVERTRIKREIGILERMQDHLYPRQETPAQRTARVHQRVRDKVEQLAFEEALRQYNHPWNESKRLRDESDERHAEFLRRMEKETVAAKLRDGTYYKKDD